MFSGKIKLLNDQKGYGFIEYNESTDIFLNYSALDSEYYNYLYESEFILYELLETENGYKACNVKPITKQEIISQ